MNYTLNTSQNIPKYGFPHNGTKANYGRLYSPTFVKAAVPVFISIICVALFGSFLACLSTLINRNLRKSATNYFIFSLALSDLITASLVMPLDLDQLVHDGKWSYGAVLCDVWYTAYLLAVPTSIMSLLAISVDRYLTLRDPLNRYRATRLMTRKRAAILIGVLWLYSLLLSLLPIMGWKEIPTQGSIYFGYCVLNATKIYSALSSVVNFLLPAVAMCFIYFRIYLIARDMNWLRDMKITTEKNLQAQAESDYLSSQTVTAAYAKRNRKILKRNLKAAKTISVLVSTFFFCWMPYTVASIVGVFYHSPTFLTPPEVMTGLLMLGYLNSALNPFLYVFHNKMFMEPYKR